jgi:hypothetical protein
MGESNEPGSAAGKRRKKGTAQEKTREEVKAAKRANVAKELEETGGEVNVIDS